MRMNFPRAFMTIAIASTFAMGCTIIRRPADPPPPAPAPAPAAKPAPKRTLKKGLMFKKFKFRVNSKGEVELPAPVLFETGTARLAPESDAVLEIIQKYLEQKPEITKLRIEGHTDSDGEADANQDLSERRAMAVGRWLVGKGIDCKRLVPVGFGEKRLVVSPDDTEDKKAQNRRVVPVNAEVKGNPVGGMPVDGGGTIAGDACQ